MRSISFLRSTFLVQVHIDVRMSPPAWVDTSLYDSWINMVCVASGSFALSDCRFRTDGCGVEGQGLLLRSGSFGSGRFMWDCCFGELSGNKHYTIFIILNISQD